MFSKNDYETIGAAVKNTLFMQFYFDNFLIWTIRNDLKKQTISLKISLTLLIPWLLSLKNFSSEIKTLSAHLKGSEQDFTNKKTIIEAQVKKIIFIYNKLKNDPYFDMVGEFSVPNTDTETQTPTIATNTPQKNAFVDPNNRTKSCIAAASIVTSMTAYFYHYIYDYDTFRTAPSLPRGFIAYLWLILSLIAKKAFYDSYPHENGNVDKTTNAIPENASDNSLMLVNYMLALIPIVLPPSGYLYFRSNSLAESLLPRFAGIACPTVGISAILAMNNTTRADMLSVAYHDTKALIKTGLTILFLVMASHITFPMTAPSSSPEECPEYSAHLICLYIIAVLLCLKKRLPRSFTPHVTGKEEFKYSDIDQYTAILSEAVNSDQGISVITLCNAVFINYVQCNLLADKDNPTLAPESIVTGTVFLLVTQLALLLDVAQLFKPEQTSGPASGVSSATRSLDTIGNTPPGEIVQSNLSITAVSITAGVPILLIDYYLWPDEDKPTIASQHLKAVGVSLIAIGVSLMGYDFSKSLCETQPQKKSEANPPTGTQLFKPEQTDSPISGTSSATDSEAEAPLKTSLVTTAC